MTRATLLMITAAFASLLSACGGESPADPTTAADTILTNARVYTLSWDDPGRDGTPAENAPYRDGQWRADAEAVALRDGRILAVGSASDIERHAGRDTQRFDLAGATVIPGLVESHGHFNELGEQAERVDLADITTMREMAARVRERAAVTPVGEWVVGGGWDEGAWANDLPTKAALDEAAPQNPVMLKGRRGFGIVVNQRALDLAGITDTTPSPSGGDIVRDENGEATGVFLNRAQLMIYDVMPEASLEQKKRRVLHGLMAIAKAGYVNGHHAGIYSDYMPAYVALAEAGELPIRVEGMIAARAENMPLVKEWIARGPTADREAFFQVRGVKAYYDGSLGSRGAKLLDDYSDMPGHKGVAGEEYGFPEAIVSEAIAAGFQAGVHAIGDGGNRDVLDYYESVLMNDPAARGLRHRIEHAQIVHPDDFARFGEMNLVASMEPGHAVEDSPWAEDRVGAKRIRGGYAWRTLRLNGAGLIFNSDLSGTDFDIFYGLHCAVTRTNRDGEPQGGWYPEQAMTIEEAVRAYTSWPAWSSMREDLTGTIEAGKWADLTVLSLDPFRTAVDNPHGLLDGKALMTIVAGRIVYDGRD
jgi:predicted amidohydrolase YtcJ